MYLRIVLLCARDIHTAAGAGVSVANVTTVRATISCAVSSRRPKSAATVSPTRRITFYGLHAGCEMYVCKYVLRRAEKR